MFRYAIPEEFKDKFESLAQKLARLSISSLYLYYTSNNQKEID